jgi:hypothetical protein
MTPRGSGRVGPWPAPRTGTTAGGPGLLAAKAALHDQVWDALTAEKIAAIPLLAALRPR